MGIKMTRGRDGVSAIQDARRRILESIRQQEVREPRATEIERQGESLMTNVSIRGGTPSHDSTQVQSVL